MFERETKREKILEARHREMRLKEKTKLEGKDEEAKEEVEEEKPEEILKRVRNEFFDVIEGELRRRERARAKLKVEQVTVRPVTGSSVGCGERRPSWVAGVQNKTPRKDGES